MARTSKLLLPLAACVAALGQTSGDTSASVQGTVTNAITGEPVVRAHIALRLLMNGPQVANAQKRYGALTTAEGKFSITGMDPGRYTVAVDRIGFVTTTDVPLVILQAGDKKDDLKLKLVPTGAITGRVVNSDGEPVENAAVEVEMGPYGRGPSSRTDEKGQFRIGGLTPGRYRVRATPESLPIPPEIRTDGTKEVHYAATYYPSALLPGDAARVEARAGTDTSGTDIRLVRTPIVRVSGTVPGLPPGTQNAQIEVRKGRNTLSRANVKADGTFEIWKLTPGKYTIDAVWNPANGTHMQSSSADIEVSDANVDHVILNVIPPMDFSGHVEYDDEQARPPQPTAPPPQRSGNPQMPQRTPPRRIMIEPVDGFMSQSPDLSADDSFHLSGLAPGRYRVSLSWGYVKSMRIGSTQADGAVLDLRQGAPGTSLTLVLSSAMGSVTGTVSDDRGPLATAMVALVPEDWDGMGQPRRASTKPDGAYQMANIAPGKYRIVAVDEADRNLLTYPNLVDLMDTMESIEIHANDKLTKDLKRVKP
jgi:hypothetical protein